MDPITFLLIIAFAWFTLHTISRIPWFSVKNPSIGLGYAMYRTTRLNQLIDRLASKGKVGWKFVFDIGIVSGIGILLIGLLIFTINIPLFFLPPSDGTNGGTAIVVTPVIPGITVSLQSLPYFFVAIMIGAAVHEFAHGIAARVEGVELKSTGLFVFFVLFGAFVEPDEQSLNSKSRRAVMRIMAAGALSNMLVAGFFFLILLIPQAFPLLITPLYQPEPEGALIIETIPENPAALAGLKPGYAIVRIESSSKEYIIRSVNDFHSFVDTAVFPNQTLTFHFANPDILPITLQTIPRSDNTSKGFIGVRTWEFFPPRFFAASVFLNLIPYWLFNCVLYIFTINLMLAIMNLLPIPFLDGDKLLASYLGPRFRQHLSLVRYFALGVLLANLLFSFYFNGWQSI
ncbi:MAG: site-2 protease family protein [Candidatus Thorarchaeota archaeon]